MLDSASDKDRTSSQPSRNPIREKRTLPAGQIEVFSRDMSLRTFSHGRVGCYMSIPLRVIRTTPYRILTEGTDRA